MNYPATKLHSRGAEMFSAAGVVRGYYAANSLPLELSALTSAACVPDPKSVFTPCA